VSAATLIIGADNLTPRQALAFSLSLLLHLTLAFVILLSIRAEAPSPPLEVSILEGPKGPASPLPGEKGAEAGPIGPPSGEVTSVEAPALLPAQLKASHVKVVASPHPAPKPARAERPGEAKGLLAALKKSGPSPTTQVFENAPSSVALGKAQSDDAAPGSPTEERSIAAVGSVATTRAQVSGTLGAGVESVVLPGRRGGNSGVGDAVAGGGGTGRGGFSVSGAGAGGAGRSYASIWECTQRYLAGLRGAYNNALRNDAALRGMITVRYEILRSGAVGEVVMLSSQLSDPHLEQEVLNQIRGWRYTPEPTGTVVVTWPFSFLPPS
jgi:TonB family protein